MTIVPAAEELPNPDGRECVELAVLKQVVAYFLFACDASCGSDGFLEGFNGLQPLLDLKVFVA